jgi:osmotically inducible protein OsmC
MDRHATAQWKGNLKEGTGTIVSTQSGALTNLGYSFKSRFEDETGKSGTNPEELIAAAHAGCFAMQFSAFLADNGTPGSVEVKAVVTLVPGTGITQSALNVVGTVPGIDAAKFTEIAERAKAECPVSKALGAIKVTLDARLA